MGLGYRVRLRLGMGADVRWGQKSCIQVVIAHHGRSYQRPSCEMSSFVRY